MNRLKQEYNDPQVVKYIKEQNKTAIKQANKLIASLQGLIHNNRSTAIDFIRVYERYHQEVPENLELHDVAEIIEDAKQCIENIKAKNNIK